MTADQIATHLRTRGAVVGIRAALDELCEAVAEGARRCGHDELEAPNTPRSFMKTERVLKRGKRGRR